MATPLISFRVDASLAMGSGHVMRCLTLADALRARGAHCRFVTRRQAGDLTERIAAQGHPVLALPAPLPGRIADPRGPAHADWLGAAWADDAAQTRAVLAGPTSDWLVIDHYAIDARWESALRPAAQRVMVIDDLADRPHDADLLLDQSQHDDALGRYRALLPAGCERRLGPAHGLLRDAFDAPPPRRRTGRIEQLFVYFGGNDRHNLAGQAVAALWQLPLLGAEMVLGADHPHRAAVHAAAAGRPGLRLVDQSEDIAGAMASADLALGVCGMAAWERCAMALPSLVCINADNQREDSLALHRLGAVQCLGDAADLGASDWTRAIEGALADPLRMAGMAERAAALVAGHAENRQGLLNRLLADVR
jgi:UDP-2,4-diacetamido-2,4,6-trideoxy-beta-L-altropyranose hydrolase